MLASLSNIKALECVYTRYVISLDEISNSLFSFKLQLSNVSVLVSFPKKPPHLYPDGEGDTQSHIL